MSNEEKFDLFMNETDNQAFLSKLSKSTPSDSINLTEASVEKLMSLWKEDHHSDKLGDIPSDILFSGTIPLPDCKITVNELVGREKNQKISFRVAIFENYMDIIKNTPESEIATVGGVEMKLNEMVAEVIAPLMIKQGENNNILVKQIAYKSDFTQHRRDYMSQHYEQGQVINAFQKMIAATLRTWYSMQIALLHPVIKNVFANPKTGILEPEEKKPVSKKKRKPKVKYIKYHKIDPEDLDNILHGSWQDKNEPNENVQDGEVRKYERHTLAWYSIGHWRELQNGKKTFVQGAWKGPLREKHSPESPPERDRVIAQVEEIPGAADFGLKQ